MIYETYKSAKAAYPDCDAVLTTGPYWLGDSTVVGKFIPTYLAKGAGEYRICGDSFPGFIGHDLGYVVAEPPELMTVKEFLAAGRKFVAGDDVCGINGLRFTITSADCVQWNEPNELDDRRFVINAKCLKEAKVDKQKTKVEYKRKNFTSAWEVVRHYETGTDLFTKSNCRDYRKIESIDDLLRYQFCLFVKRETPITWEGEVMQHINGGPLQGVLYCFDVLFCGDQRIKNAAIEVCKLVAKRNGGCE